MNKLGLIITVIMAYGLLIQTNLMADDSTEYDGDYDGQELTVPSKSGYLDSDDLDMFFYYYGREDEQSCFTYDQGG